jgi:hypothetical protein
MQPDEKPEAQLAHAESLLDLELRGIRNPPPRTWQEWIVDALVIVVGMTLAFALALLHLGEP